MTRLLARILARTLDHCWTGLLQPRSLGRPGCARVQISKLTSMSLQPLLTEAFTAAGTMGLPADGEPPPEPCWGTLGDAGSTLTMAGAEPMQTDWDRTTARGREEGRSCFSSEERRSTKRKRGGRSSPGWLCSTGCSPCRMRALAAAGLGLTGTGATHTGLGWMGGLLLRMLLAFSVAEPAAP